MITLGLACNVYNEANALPGFLEMAACGFWDDVCFYHAGPGGKYSDDGTIELIEKWGFRIAHGKIDEGFGIVRTATIRFSKCDWVMLLDADERFYPWAPQITCAFQDIPKTVPSNWENREHLSQNLHTTFTGEPYAQGAWLKSILEHHTTLGAVTAIRRHWHDFSWRWPTQNWLLIPDWQMRIVRNIEPIHYDANRRMHEILLDDRGPINTHRPNNTHGPFFDHYHMFFKEMEPEQRAHDIRIYDAIHLGAPVPQT